jgi:hypothetical protein
MENTMKKSLALRLGAISAGLALATGSAMAALPAGADAAIADMKTDAVALAGAFLIVIIAVAAVKILRKGPG